MTAKIQKSTTIELILAQLDDLSDADILLLAEQLIPRREAILRAKIDAHTDDIRHLPEVLAEFRKGLSDAELDELIDALGHSREGQ